MSTIEVRIDRKLFRTGGRALTAIEGLAFTMAPGEIACIVGPSGCGKTTLLSIIAGLDPRFEGEVKWGGAARGRLGVMFQTPRLMPWLTVRDNVRLALDPPPRKAGAAEALLKEMRLDGFLDAFPRQLSGGLQRRVALARAFVTDPDLLLLDEPFQSLDAPTAERLRALLLDLWKRRRPTILFVTHDLREALSIGDRVLFLSASPARVVLDLAIELTRPRGLEGPAVEALRRRLLATYPDLLRGLADIELGQEKEGTTG
ncbi:MAG TPA: ABC transporter ATP-binding protein [Stellaceae bacterium]|nr:ABC transporter ATP-binding protein [Stellaceae bacterium]